VARKIAKDKEIKVAAIPEKKSQPNRMRKSRMLKQLAENFKVKFISAKIR